VEESILDHSIGMRGNGVHVLGKATAHNSPILIGLLLLSQDEIPPSLPLLILGSITNAILGAHAKSLLNKRFSKVIWLVPWGPCVQGGGLSRAGAGVNPDAQWQLGRWSSAVTAQSLGRWGLGRRTQRRPTPEFKLPKLANGHVFTLQPMSAPSRLSFTLPCHGLNTSPPESLEC
jgi:hypothetical protein